ncbi:heterokaryon incompatibility protein-domain-containing protein [Aspergillus californicus]
MAMPNPTRQQGDLDPIVEGMACLALASRYEYTPVDSLSGEIRLLTIHAGEYPAPVEVSLRSAYRLSNCVWAMSDDEELDSPTAPPLPHLTPPTYEALSYACANPADTVTIQIGRRTGPGPATDDNGYKNNILVIHRDLSLALPSLRRPSEDRVIWVDAICINQLDEEERALQFQFMADVFCEAKYVICWLGPKNWIVL